MFLPAYNRRLLTILTILLERRTIEKIKTGCRTFRSALKVESENSNLLLTKEYYNTKKPVSQAVALLQHAVACDIAVAEM